MHVLYLAGRYLMARPISWLAMVAIGLGVMALIIVVSVMNGFLDETRRIIRGTTADIVVFPLQEQVLARAELEELVAAQEGVDDVCSRLVRPAVFKVHDGAETRRERPFVNKIINNSQDASINQVLVLGVAPEDELRVTGLSGYLEAVAEPALRVEDPARPFALTRARIERELRQADLPTVLVGEPLLAALRLAPGQALDIVTLPEDVDLQSESFRPTAGTFVIAGAFLTGHQEFDLGHVFIEREDFRRWCGTKQELSEAYVSVDAEASLEGVRDRLSERLTAAGLLSDVQTWKDRHRVWLGAVENERNILFIVLALFVMLTCTITFSMLTMMVQEKVRDIGVLSAMGASAGSIGGIFALCGVLIAAVGGAFGLLAGWLVTRHINEVKDWIESSLGIEIFRKDVYLFTDIPVRIDHELNLLVAVTTVVFAGVICLLPALRAARLDPVEALRHE